MKNSKIAIASALTIIAILFVAMLPAQAKTSETPKPTPPTATRDIATTVVNGEPQEPPPFAMLVATQGSAIGRFRARTLIACDQNFSSDLKGKGGYGIANRIGKYVNVCSYSISNGSIAQDVQFVAGTATASGNNNSCLPAIPVSAKFHLAPNQFVSQGSGVGVLFSTSIASESGLCLEVLGSGEVGVNVTYATP